MISWRPEGWGEIIKNRITKIAKLHVPEFPLLIRDGIEWELTKVSLFEAGADALLQSLLDSGIIKIEELKALNKNRDE